MQKLTDCNIISDIEIVGTLLSVADKVGAPTMSQCAYSRWESQATHLDARHVRLYVIGDHITISKSHCAECQKPTLSLSFFKLECNCFIMLFEFLLYNNVNQL